MIVEEKININASREAVWAVVIDIENGADFITGIQKIDILEKPQNGLIGLKWAETRLMFGKEAKVDKWVTEAVDNDYYITRAEDGGFVFNTAVRIKDAGSDGVTLAISHESLPQTFGAKIMSIPMRLFFTGVIRKAALQDLADIKAAAERA